MTLRIVGAGLGRTGTMSLKIALERLLGAPCYHMIEVFAHPEHLPVWHAAVRGSSVDWDELFDGYAAVVDWPAATFWHEISSANPDSRILLSTRDSGDWWRSINATILENFRRDAPPGTDAWFAMVGDLMRRHFSSSPPGEREAIAAYEKHNDEVRRTAPHDRLVDWRPSDGWGPLCAALNVAVPDEPFPHANTTEEFRSRFGLAT